jgi:hypothetical protein
LVYILNNIGISYKSSTGGFEPLGGGALPSIPAKNDNDMYNSTGIVRYERANGYKLTVEVGRELARYYYSLIPKYNRTNRPRYGAHITIVRVGVEVPPILSAWGRYEGEKVEFLYDPYVHYGRSYYWLNVFCRRLEVIRSELGLPITSRYTVPPEGFTKCFHMTIANEKNL